MKCFYHPITDAVALCKSCGRGLCSSCIAEVGLNCSCRNRCEPDVAILNDLVQRGRTVYQKYSATYFGSGLFMLLIGSVFFFIGAFRVSRGGAKEWDYFLTMIGVLFVGWAVSLFVSAKKIKQK